MSDEPHVIYRTIAAVLVRSSDDYLLLGRKDPRKGGVYKNVWHLPGGGVQEGETLEETGVREVFEEAGLRLHPAELKPLGPIDHGESHKTLKDGEVVLCKMEFHRFEATLSQTAQELQEQVSPGDDLVELKWFPISGLAQVEQIPGAREFYEKVGYIKTNTVKSK